MNKNNFFIKDELKEIRVEGQVFKYKPVNSGEELDWIEDYLEDKTEIIDGKEETKKVTNYGKLSVCKLRNIMEVPFTKDELKAITGIDKDYKNYLNSEKDQLFRKLNPAVYNPLIGEIDKINKDRKSVV